MDVLALTCWIRSPDPRAVFRVKVSKAETVFDLQEAIKNKKPVAFGDVDAGTLALYKPNDPISLPYEDHLRKFNLAAHGKSLLRMQELSEVFPEPPLKHDIHIIVDAPTIVCWLRGVTFGSYFEVKIPKIGTVDNLKEAIKDNEPMALRNVEADTLRLFRITGGNDELVRESLSKMGDGDPLQGFTLAPIFLGVPVLDPLFIVAETSAAEGGSLTLGPAADRLQEYEEIFLKVKNWGKFEHSDIERNRILKVENMDIPNFVTTFERKLARKPCLPVNPPELHTLDAPRTYFEHSENLIAQGGSQEQSRTAGLLEVMHTAYHVASYDWQRCWQRNGPCRHPLKAPVMDLIFFGALLMAGNRTAVAVKDEEWPITVVVKRDDDKELRQYRPRSDFLISNSAFPRLLVEVNSARQYGWPMELTRMLTTGAFVVRFANKFVSTFRKSDFVLCAVFIWGDGAASRYTLFQNQNDETVYYSELQLSLNDPHDRVEFAHYLYNLLAVELDPDQDSTVKGALCELRRRINDCRLKSMHIKPDGDGDNNNDNDNDDDGASRGGGDYHAQLRAHGYEVKPEDMVDDSGGVWGPLSKVPDHILTVCRPMNSNEEFIAKKIREELNELEIFRLLNTIPSKSDHIITLIDSFNGPKAIESKVPQVCLGLIKGVAYLHEHRIAHMDIKPDNLVLDKNFNLKIIDFDIAVQLKDEDQEVDDHCGTEGWIAPEVVKKLRYSPIKADRWSCGQVLLFLLDVFGKEDISLRTFAGDLVTDDPKQRPSLLEWGRYLAPSLSDAGNIENFDARKAPRRERTEVDGEGTGPPNVKKQRLESGQCDMGRT